MCQHNCSSTKTWDTHERAIEFMARGYGKENFVQSFLLTGQPSLLLVSTGNISNVELEELMQANWERIEQAFTAHRFIEITRTALIIHD